MKLRGKWGELVWWVGIVVLAVAGLAVWSSQRWDYPLNQLASVDPLVAKFEEIVFEDYRRRDSSTLARWNGPYTVYPASRLNRSLQESLRLYVQELDRLTGVGAAVTDSAQRATVTLHMAPLSKFRELAKSVSRRPDTDGSNGPMHCFFAGSLSESIYSRGVIVIDESLYERAARSCLLEQLYQGLGPGMSLALTHSISRNLYLLVRLALNDKILLRALYDARLQPGMSRAEAMPVARVIIKELVEAVQRDGEEALIHPRYAARMAGKR